MVIELKTAAPTMSPMPSSDLVTIVAMITVKNSGAEDPTAMKVAPATSSGILSTSTTSSIASTKKSSQTMAMPTKQ